MDKKPNVFPVDPQATEDVKVEIDSDYEKQRLNVAEDVYSSSINETGMSAIEAMRKRTEEQIRLRDEQLKKNVEQTASYQKKYEEAEKKPVNVQQQKVSEPEQKVLSSQPKSPINNTPLTNVNMNQVDPYIQQISQPQFNAAFDVIPLPSKGKLYRNKKANIKVAYMTTGDENILTSPNLLQSGEFLEILMNRKILENDLRYKQLHVGDRNAIMIWLRATSYGEMYPVTLLDELDNPFDTEINLNELKIKELGAEPDEEGYFDFTLPVSKNKIKFKLLTVGDLEDIEKQMEIDKEKNLPVNNISTYTLEKQIVEVNGDRNQGVIKDFVTSMRIKDAKDLRDYIQSIESGIDLELEIATPRGGSIKTFLPLNVKFFWPDFTV